MTGAGGGATEVGGRTGQIVFLNGISRSGTTSLARAVQDVMEAPSLETLAPSGNAVRGGRGRHPWRPRSQSGRRFLDGTIYDPADPQDTLLINTHISFATLKGIRTRWAARVRLPGLQRDGTETGQGGQGVGGVDSSRGRRSPRSAARHCASESALWWSGGAR